MSIFSESAMILSRSKIFCSGMVRNSNSWQRESIVSGTLCSSVVAMIKTTFGGGSSRVFSNALNELFDWGRPASVTLAVLVSRDGRELPIQADAAGAEVVLARGQHLKLRGPEPLRLELVDTGA